MSIQTPLNKVRGLGSAQEGVGHFWHQRVTAVALVPLVLWFLVSLYHHIGDPYDEIVVWLGKPTTAIPLLFLILAGFYHMRLGMQVVVEDYIQKEFSKILLLLLNNLVAIGLGIVCVYAVLKLSFGV